MGVFDSLFGGYKVEENCPNCNHTFESEISDHKLIFYCPVCRYLFDYSTAPDASYSFIKDSTVRLYKNLRKEISETKEELENLPSKVKFPKHLKNKINYDTEEGSLVFKGVMSKKERQELLKLSQDEIYKEAIKELFQESQYNHSLKTVENELEVLIFAMFVMKDRVLDKFYATKDKRIYKKVLSKFCNDLIHYAVNQLYLQGRSAKREEVNEFIYGFCNVLVPKRDTQYDESSRAHYLRVLKEDLNDTYSGPIRTFLDNLGIQHGPSPTQILLIQYHIVGALKGLAAQEPD